MSIQDLECGSGTFGNDKIRMSNAERTTRLLNQEKRKQGKGQGVSFGSRLRSLLPSQLCLLSRKSLSSIETRSAPAFARCYPRSFAFYLGNPFPRFLLSCFPYSICRYSGGREADLNRRTRLLRFDDH